MIEGLPGEVKEFQVLLPDSMTEVIANKQKQNTGSVSVTNTLFLRNRSITTSLNQYLDMNHGIIFGG